LRFLILWVLRFNLLVELFPLFVETLSFILVLFDGILLLLFRVHLKSIFEGKRIDLFQNGLEGNQRLLKDLVPVVVSKMDDNWNQHWECFFFVVLEDVQEVVIFKEAHCSISNL